MKYANKQRKTTEAERIQISSIKLEILMEYSSKHGHNKGQKP